jgi:hypothetical protein
VFARLLGSNEPANHGCLSERKLIMFFLLVSLVMTSLFEPCASAKSTEAWTIEKSDRQPKATLAQKLGSVKLATSPKVGSNVVLSPAAANESTQQVARASLAKIFSDRTLWGRDFSAVLAFLESWSRIDEQKIYVFPDRVVGGKRHKTREDAQQAATKLIEAMKATRPRPRPEFLELLRGVPAQAPDQLRVEVITFLPDDESLHVAWTSRSMRFLGQNLSVATVRERLGPPEKTTLELIQNETERRPVVLTLHSYAGGAVVFAESDWATPGYVDRVILDVPAIRAALF